MKKSFLYFAAITVIVASIISCKPKNATSSTGADAAAKAYVAPGKYDEFYNFVSGGFSGQMSVYGPPRRPARPPAAPASPSSR